MTTKDDNRFNSTAPNNPEGSGNENENKIYSHHDALFRDFFNEKEVAYSFIKEYIPGKITREINLDSLKIAKDSFIDKEMDRYFTDILYEVEYRDKPLFIYFLFEHKSAEEWFICFQLLKYMVKIWENFLKQKKDAQYLPAIIPMVIYHGKKKWAIRNDFISLFEDTTDLEEYIPDFKYDLYDISHLSDEELKGTVLLKILFMTLKYVFSPNLSDKLEDIFKLFGEFSNKTKAIEYLEILLRYLVSAGDFKMDKLQETITRVIEEGGEIMTTLADRLRQEGIQKGKENNEWTVVKNSLSMGLPIDTIAKITALPIEKIKQMKAKINQGQMPPIPETGSPRGRGPEHRV